MVKVSRLPTYREAQKLVKCLDGINKNEFKSMWNTIWSLRGTPQETVDWQNPEDWIPKRLSGRDQEIASKIWTTSNKEVNPRHIRGISMLIDNYNLMGETRDNNFNITDRGMVFISSPENEIIREIDREEACTYILYLCSIHKDAKRIVFLNGWEDYLKNNSKFRKDSVIKESLRKRLTSLLDRKLISKDGNKHNITPKGDKYLKSFDDLRFTEEISEEKKIYNLVQNFNEKQKSLLKIKLKNLSPYQLENLVKDLLDAMGYEDVNVTPQTHDGSVDVVGQIENGITMVKEAIQVKKTSSTVGRPVLDNLRGSLYRFDALQGTVITTSDFSKGAKAVAREVGAPPITLINGDKLVELLVEHELLVKKYPIEYYTINDDYFDSEQEE